jgi:hypothetical protein
MENGGRATLPPEIGPYTGPLLASVWSPTDHEDQSGFSPGCIDSGPLTQPPFQEAVAAQPSFQESAAAQADAEDDDEMLGAFDRASERDVVYTFLACAPRSQLVDA